MFVMINQSLHQYMTYVFQTSGFYVEVISMKFVFKLRRRLISHKAIRFGRQICFHVDFKDNPQNTNITKQGHATSVGFIIYSKIH